MTEERRLGFAELARRLAWHQGLQGWQFHRDQWAGWCTAINLSVVFALRRFLPAVIAG